MVDWIWRKSYVLKNRATSFSGIVMFGSLCPVCKNLANWEITNVDFFNKINEVIVVISEDANWRERHVLARLSKNIAKLRFFIILRVYIRCPSAIWPALRALPPPVEPYLSKLLSDLPMWGNKLLSTPDNFLLDFIFTNRTDLLELNASLKCVDDLENIWETSESEGRVIGTVASI